MATSLAEQLQRLAVPQTSVIKHSKIKTSFLFDPKEAAGLKRDTFYQIGLEGLEELIQKNTVFEQFQNTLFHITSRDFERSIQTADVNSKLDKNIKNFLLFLSPYFMLKSSHKALEWLINRYAIHEYNRDDILKLILPYHESNVFVKMLQLLKFKNTKDKFYFLKELQKPGVHLPKQNLLNHAANNSDFIKFVTEYVMQLLNVHQKPYLLTVAFNFYCCVFTGVLEYSDTIKEHQVTQILPLLLKGLNSAVPDYCAASFVILARLVTKCSLSDRLLDKFVEKISDLKVQSLKTESVLVLVVLYQSQKGYKNLPPQAAANFSEKEWLPRILHDLNSSGSYIDPFLKNLVKRCAVESLNNDLELTRILIKNCLDVVKMDDVFIPVFMSCLLDALRPKTKYTSKATEWLIEVIQTLERQYPNAFDKEVYRIFSTGFDKRTLKRKKCLSKILKNTMAYKGKYVIFEKLYHPSAQIRGEAVKYLKDNYHQLRDTDKEIIKSSLVERLSDDNFQIVEQTLTIIERNTLLEQIELKNSLSNLLNKCRQLGSDWGPISKKALNILVSNNSKDWEIFFVIFPYMLPKSDVELKFCRKVLKKEFFATQTLFQLSTEKLISAHSPKDFIKVFLKNMEQSDNAGVEGFLNVFNKIPKENRTVYQNFISILILSSLLPKQGSFELGVKILETLQTQTECSIIFNKEGTIIEYVDAAAQHKYPIYGYLKCLQVIQKKIQMNKRNFNLRYFSKENHETMFLTYVVNFLCGGKISSDIYVKSFFNTFCINLCEKTNAILNLCLCKVLQDSSTLNILSYLEMLLTTNDVEEVKQLLFIEETTAVLILILLYIPDDNIRVKMLNLIKYFVQISTRKSSSYYYLFEGITKQKEEILMDHEQVPLVLFNILDPTNTKGKKHVADLNLIRNHLIERSVKEESPLYVKGGILKLLSYINSFDLLEETSKLAIKVLDEGTHELRGFKAQILICVTNRIEEKVLSKLSLDSQSWNFIQKSIKNDKSLIYLEESNHITPCPLMLNQLNKDIFKIIEDEVEAVLLDLIIEMVSIAQNPEVLPAAVKIFKHIDLNAELILEPLKKMKEVQSPKIDLINRKSKGNIIPTVDILDTLEWKKGVTILEFIQDKKKIRNFYCLLQTVFDLLKKCLDFDEQVVVEYPKQLLLSTILHCCEKSEEPLSTKVFNMELIVQCIRVSQNPQTHHHALLVLAHTAQLIPDQVLHHMMTIFTFMGSSVLRHDDAYSFQLITKIINTIIPILVQDNKESNIANVLRVFVDVLLDVPEHRRMPMYQQLLERIGIKDNLYLFLLLVFESQVLNSTNKKEAGHKRVEIGADLCRIFPPQFVMYTSLKLMNYLHKLPEEKNDEPFETEGAFSAAIYTTKDFRHFKYLLVKFVANLLGSREFVHQVAQLNEEEELALEGLLKEMIVNTLQFIQRMSKVVDKNKNSLQSQYWKVLLNLSYDILDNINALVTPQMFLLVTKGLLVHNLPTVRRRMLELLNNKLQFEQKFFCSHDKNEIYSLIPPIVGIIEKIRDDVESELEIIIQTALLSLKLLVRALAQENPTKFVQILEFVTDLIKSGKPHTNVLASLVLTLAELCVHLRAHAISSLPHFMPAIIKILKTQNREETPTVLLRSVITTIEKILDSLPLFLSPYLQKLLVELALLISKWNLNSDEHKTQPFVMKIISIKQKIGSTIPLRVLLPPVEQSYTNLVQKKAYLATGELMNIFAENLTNLNGPDINNNLTDLTNFFLNALKFRTENDVSSSDCAKVETHVIKAFTILILKLSESSFRPLYYKLYDWAVRSELKSERLITFYSLSTTIAQSLKGLFVLFAGHFLNNAAQLLDACNQIKSTQMFFEDEDKNLLLLENVLKTLNAVFLYDTQKFINKDRFDVLMQPLVDQLENILGGLEALEKRNNDLLTPCIVHFCLATADDALWKQMNYQILLKMRHNEAKIRLVSLTCLREVVKKLGEDFLPLLPETIPFLAELLEDEDEGIEKACQKAVQEMEKVLGEPLQKYF